MRMYAVDYGEPEIARREYASLAGKASACAGCAAPCLGSCPAGIAIPELTREAHRRLG
jgi:predicted aldo/keto reductase-like oxidoreductase